MKVAIVGCGAMGTVLGAYLTKNGCSVEMVDVFAAHVEMMNKKGAHIIGSVDMTIPVKAITPDQMSGIYDMVFLFTKQTANEVVLTNLLPHLSETSTVCTLQNGVPEPYVAKIVGENRTVGGTVLWGATFIEPGVSELTVDLEKCNYLFEIGEINGKLTPRIKEVAEILEKMGRPCHVSETLMASRWSKLVNNACVSGMSAACAYTFGQVMENNTSRACLSYLGREVKQCCEAAGYKLPVFGGGFSPDSLDIKDQAMFDENQQMFIDMYKGYETAKASMLQDLEKGFKTEVTMINGFVCETGDKYGIETPFNDKVVEIVTKIEKGELPLSAENLSLFTKDMFEYVEYQAK